MDEVPFLPPFMSKMRRRLFNLVTAASLALSLALSLASFLMWARSLYVTEGWESKPRPAGMIYDGSGYHSQWAVESAKGRLVFVSYRIFIRSPDDPPITSGYRYDPYIHKWVKLPSDPPITSGYYRSAQPRTPERQSRHFPDYPPPRYRQEYVRSEWRIPGVQWGEKKGYSFGPPGWFLGVSWPLIGCAGLILPAAWALRKWGRPLRLRRPRFPVLPKREN